MGAGVSTPSNISNSSGSRVIRSSMPSHSSNNNNSNNNGHQQQQGGGEVILVGGNTTPNNNLSNDRSAIRPSPILARPYTMSQRIVTSDTIVPGQFNANTVDPMMSSNSSVPSQQRTYRYIQTNGPSMNNTSDKPLGPFVHVSEQDGGLANNNSELISPTAGMYCLNPPSDVNNRLDTQVEVRVYPCNSQNGGSGKKKFTQFMVKPEGVIIQGTNRRSDYDLGSEYSRHIGRKLTRYELADSRACQLLVTTHAKSFYVVPAPEAFSRHSGTCRLLGDRKHPPTPHTLQVGDFLRVGSVGVVVIETHDGVKHKALSEEKIQRIMKDTASGGFIDLGETDGENSEASVEANIRIKPANSTDQPICYMCFDDTDDDDNPLITPCKCLGDTKYVHVDCLRKWHTAEADNEICFLSSVDATCSVCKSTFKSDFKLRNGRTVKLFKSSLEPPYISLLVATKHEMAQRLFNTRFQLSFSTLLKPDRKNSTRALLLGRSSGSDMVLDYRTVSARHASLRFKNNEFVFCDAGSSNGSYLYLRRPVELTSSQGVQFRLGRSMISMKVVNKWNRRFLRAVRRTTQSSSSNCSSSSNNVINSSNSVHRSSNSSIPEFYPDEHSIGSEEDVLILQNNESGNNNSDNAVPKRRAVRTRDSIMSNLPPPGQLHQTSSQHLELLYALAYPKRNTPDKLKSVSIANNSSSNPSIKETLLPIPTNIAEEKNDEDSNLMHVSLNSRNLQDMELNEEDEMDLENEDDSIGQHVNRDVSEENKSPAVANSMEVP